MFKTNSSGVAGHFEPEVSHTFLPRCQHCGGSHPLARKPVMSADKCPDCGGDASQPGPTVTQTGRLGLHSPSVILGNLFLAIGRKLGSIAKD